MEPQVKLEFVVEEMIKMAAKYKMILKQEKNGRIKLDSQQRKDFKNFSNEILNRLFKHVNRKKVMYQFHKEIYRYEYLMD